MDRPTKEDFERALSFVDDTEYVGDPGHDYYGILAAEVRALREEMGNPPLQRVADEITKAVVDNMREEIAGLRAAIARVEALGSGPGFRIEDTALISLGDVRAALRGPQ